MKNRTDYALVAGMGLFALGIITGLIAAALHSMLAFAIAACVAGAVILMGCEV